MVHFGCTSEDINNLAYALMLEAAHTGVVLPALERPARAAGCARPAAMPRSTMLGALARTDRDADHRRQGVCEFRRAPREASHEAPQRRSRSSAR